ncbi:MAG TPA: hypothetical protein DDW52_22965 [Planctomycetaceae bacterium]|nr:hypothetical protein [Planctomycetaceae bacterium]
MATQSAVAIQWLSRTIAVVVLMVLPGYLGLLIDQALGTKYFTAIGMVLGMGLTTIAFVALSNKLIPQARGRALTDEEFNGESEDTEEDGPSNAP